MSNKIDDKLFSTILSCMKNQSKPDVHSFTIKILNGTAFVDCRAGEVYVESHYEEVTTRFVGTAVAATNRLHALGADPDTISI